jgi:hypothetical protein
MGRRRSPEPQGPPEPGMPAGPTRCGACGGEDLTRVPMSLGDGSGVVFVSCGGCESREWFETTAHGWVPLPIDVVLSRSARKR